MNNAQNPALETIFNAAKALPARIPASTLSLACRGGCIPGVGIERLLTAADSAEGFFESKPVA